MAGGDGNNGVGAVCLLMGLVVFALWCYMTQCGRFFFRRARLRAKGRSLEAEVLDKGEARVLGCCWRYSFRLRWQWQGNTYEGEFAEFGDYSGVHRAAEAGLVDVVVSTDDAGVALPKAFLEALVADAVHHGLLFLTFALLAFAFAFFSEGNGDALFLVLISLFAVAMFILGVPWSAFCHLFESEETLL